MAATHSVFRFTIGQGMAVIAALAVLFALFPMPLAIIVAILTSCCVLLNRSRAPNLVYARESPILAQSVGCLCSLLGFIGGAILGVRLIIPPGADSGLAVAAIGFWFGLLGAAVAYTAGYLVARGRPKPRSAFPVAADLQADKIRAEIQTTAQLIKEAEHRATMKSGRSWPNTWRDSGKNSCPDCQTASTSAPCHKHVRRQGL